MKGTMRMKAYSRVDIGDSSDRLLSPKLVLRWTHPNIIGPHGHGDQYKALDVKVTQPCQAKLVLTNADGTEAVHEIFDFKKDGVVMGMYNPISSIERLAHFALDAG